MWLVKKTASTVYKSANTNLKKLKENVPTINIQNISSNIPKIANPLKKSSTESNSQVGQALQPVFKNKKLIMPTNRMAIVAEMSYNLQFFEEIVTKILQKLSVFRYEPKKAKQTLNTLVLVCYLLKHGATALVDELRQEMKIFQEHSQLSILKAYIDDDKQISQLKEILPEIRDRADHIVLLLTNKKMLLKEKQVAMKVKEKIMLGEAGKGRLEKDQITGSVSTGKMEKVDSFLEHYVWKYWDKLDNKLDLVADKIIEKIDEYLDLEHPESFQIDELEETDQQPLQTESDLKCNDLIKQQKRFIQAKDDIKMNVEEVVGSGASKEPVIDTELI